MHPGVQVNRQILELTLGARNESFDALARPAQHAREQRVRVGADRLEHVDLVVAADFLQLGIFGPGGLGELFSISISIRHCIKRRWVDGKKRKGGIPCKYPHAH